MECTLQSSPRDLTMNSHDSRRDEAEIRALVEGFMKSIRAKDLRGVMAVFAPDVVSFDFSPPLQHGGAEPFRQRWQELFTSYTSAIDYEVRDLRGMARDDLAFSHSPNRIAGTLQNGQKSERCSAGPRVTARPMANA
jgi:uncharacterized protein (TIGR02246 family)